MTDDTVVPLYPLLQLYRAFSLALKASIGIWLIRRSLYTLLFFNHDPCFCKILHGRGPFTWCTLQYTTILNYRVSTEDLHFDVLQIDEIYVC